MRDYLRLASLSLVLASIFGCSSLHVRPAAHEAARGIPFYLPRQDIVLEELGFDDKGNWAQVVEKRVTLVTRPDPTRGFRVANAPHWFANSKFTIERSSGGVVKSVTGESDDQLAETVIELGKILASAAALDAEDADLAAELQAQVAARDALVKDLKALGLSAGKKEGRIKELEEALSLVHARISEIKASKPKKTKGVGVSARTVLGPKVVADTNEIENDLSSISDGVVRVYLVPVE